MTVATTVDFKPPGVTSCVAYLIKFIKIVNAQQAQLEGCKTFKAESERSAGKKVITIIFC